MRLPSRIAFAFIAALLALCVRAAHADDLMAVLNKTPELSTLAKLIVTAGLADDLKTAPVLTLLAPTNDAFAKIPKDVLDDLQKPENKAKLRALLLYHALGQKFTVLDVQALPVGSQGPSVAGPPLTLTNVDPPTINGSAKIIKTDIMADNGVIHEIDAVLMPPVKAPKPAPMAVDKGRAGEKLVGTESVAALAAKLPELSTFAKLLKMTSLGETLAKRGPLTVFAPTNAALDKALKGDALATAESLEKSGDLETVLVPILMRHIVAGAYAASDLTALNGQTLSTVSRGVTLKVTTKDNAVLINGVPVAKADIAAKNGVLHIIDGVLPP